MAALSAATAPGPGPSGGSGAWIGLAGYLLAALLWGLNFPLTARMMQHLDPFWVSPWRYVIAGVFLTVWVALTLGPAKLRPPIAWRRIVWLGLFVAGFLVLFNVGLFQTHPVTAAAITAGSPVYTVVVARIVIGARPGPGFWGATLLTLLGSAIALFGRIGGLGAEAVALAPRWGALLLVAAMVCWTLYSIYAQRWFPVDTPQLRRTFLSTACAVPWLFAFWVLARALGLAGPPNLSPPPLAIADLVVAGIGPTALATVGWNTGVARLGIQAGAICQNLVPVFVVLISFLFFGVSPTGTQLLGGAIVLGGVAYMQWRGLRAARD